MLYSYSRILPMIVRLYQYDVRLSSLRSLLIFTFHRSNHIQPPYQIRYYSAPVSVYTASFHNIIQLRPCPFLAPTALVLSVPIESTLLCARSLASSLFDLSILLPAP